MKYLIKIEGVTFLPERDEFDEPSDEMAKQRWRAELSKRMALCKVGAAAILFRVDPVKKSLCFVETAKIDGMGSIGSN